MGESEENEPLLVEVDSPAEVAAQATVVDAGRPAHTTTEPEETPPPYASHTTPLVRGDIQEQYIDQQPRVNESVQLRERVMRHPDGIFLGDGAAARARKLMLHFKQMQSMMMMFHRHRVPAICASWNYGSPLVTHDLLHVQNGFDPMLCYAPGNSWGRYHALWLQKGVRTQDIQQVVADVNLVHAEARSGCGQVTCMVLSFMTLVGMIPAIVAEHNRVARAQRKARDFLRQKNAELFHPHGISLNYHRLCRDPSGEASPACFHCCECARDSSHFFWISITHWDPLAGRPVFPPGLVEEWAVHESVATRQFICCTMSTTDFESTLL